ncbi:putative ribonuclease H-like domain-containing protein [Tanacetum coccineum]
MYCLVVTDDYSKFSWVFFLATKDETSEILKTFITGIENLIGLKGIKKEFSVAGTPQQNRVVERKNRTLIEAARTMLADSKLPTTFWAESVNTACYVQNRVSPRNGPKWLFDIDAQTKSMTNNLGKRKRRMFKIQGMKVEIQLKGKIVSSTVNAVGLEVNVVDQKTSIKLPNDLNIPELEDIVYLDDDEENLDLKHPDFSYKKQSKRAILNTATAPRLDDINFGSTKKSLCTEFKKMMHKKFQMSSMAETPQSS